MADYLKDFVTDAINNGLKDLNEVVNKKGGASIKIDSTVTGTAVYDAVKSKVAPTDKQRIENNQKKIEEAKDRIKEIQTEVAGKATTKEQQEELKKLYKEISDSQKIIANIEKEEKEAIERAKEVAQKQENTEEKEKKKSLEEKIKDATKKATETTDSVKKMQEEIEKNLKEAEDDFLPITIASAAVENEENKKKLENATKELKEQTAKLEAQKAELKKQIDEIEAVKQNGVVLSKEQEEQLEKLKKQYDKFDDEVKKKSIESYIVTTFNEDKIIGDLRDSFVQDFNTAICGDIVSVLKENSYGELTTILKKTVGTLGSVTPNINQVIKVNNNTKKKLQLDASVLIKDSIKNATDTNIGKIVDSINKGPIGAAIAPTVQKSLQKIQTDTITQVTYKAMDIINKNDKLVKAAKYYYTYQQIMLLAENLSFKNISNLLISTAKKVWVKERDKLIKEITSKISISASGVKINL